MKTMFSLCWLCLWQTWPVKGQIADHQIQIRITDQASGHPIPCRLHLKDAAAHPIFGEGLPRWRDHFVCAVIAQLRLPPCHYSYEIEHGPEYLISMTSFTLSGVNDQTDCV